MIKKAKTIDEGCFQKRSIFGDMLFDLKSDAHENYSLAKDITYKTLISNFKEKIDSLRKTNL